MITKISAQKRAGRYNIFLNDKYAFSVSAKTIAEFILVKGKELTAEQVEEIKKFDTDAKASDLAAHYLSYEPRTVFEILKYLQKHNISETAAIAATNELTALGYIDDQQYVQLFLKHNFQVGNDGPKSIQRKLVQKGVATEIINAALDNSDEHEWVRVGQRVIKSMKYQIGKISTREIQRKMTTKLLTHGFDNSLISEILATNSLVSDEQDQMVALKKQGIKAYKRYRNLAESQRNFKIKNYLFTHGFSSTEIEAFLAGEVIDLTELPEY